MALDVDFDHHQLVLEVELAVDRHAVAGRRMAAVGIDHARGAAIVLVARLQGEAAIAVGRRQLARFDRVLRLVQEQVGVELGEADRVGLEGDDAAEHAALMRRERIQAPMRADIEEHRVRLAAAQLLGR